MPTCTPRRRLGAAALDLVAVGLLFVVWIGDRQGIPWASLIVLVFLVLPTLWGRTIGTWLCDVIVERVDGTEPGFLNAWFRHGLGMYVVGSALGAVVLTPLLVIDAATGSVRPDLVGLWSLCTAVTAFNIALVVRTTRSMADHVFGTRLVHRPRPEREPVVLLDPRTGLPRGMRPPADEEPTPDEG